MENQNTQEKKPSRTKKLLKSKMFWLFIIIIVVIIAFVVINANKGDNVEYVTAEVEMGSIIQTVSATGQIKSASEIELNFKNAGKLAILNVKVGDEVIENQILAQLRATDLSISVTKARADLAEAQANLDKLKAGATVEDIAVSEATVEQAKTDLENTEVTYSQAIANEEDNILVDINTVLTKANISLQKIYDTLYYEGNRDNFNTSNSDLEAKVRSGYDTSLIKVDDAELAYNVANLSEDEDDINQATNKTPTALAEVSTNLDNLAELLDFVILTVVLPREEVDILKTTINTERTTTDTSINTVQTAKQDLADARLNYSTKVEKAQKDLAKAQADLKFKKAAARPEDVALYKARLKKEQADLQSAQNKYDETIIRAPITGIVTDINFDIGEQTNLSEPAITMLAAENYEIEVDIPESDIVKIDVSHKVEITLDAFSSEDIFQGMVTTINPAQTEIQDVVYYRVTATFSDNQPENVRLLSNKIKPGMTANVTVSTARVDNVLIIPLRAVKEEDGNKVVQVLENNQPTLINVVLGLKGDEGLVEVKSGLTQGQQVVTFTRNGK